MKKEKTEKPLVQGKVDEASIKTGVLTELPATVRKSAPAKEISKWSMVIASVWIGILSLLKAFWGLVSDAPFGLTIQEIIYSGLALAAVFTPVYFSIIMDKISDIKLGKQNAVRYSAVDGYDGP